MNTDSNPHSDQQIHQDSNGEGDPQGPKFVHNADTPVKIYQGVPYPDDIQFQILKYQGQAGKFKIRDNSESVPIFRYPYRLWMPSRMPFIMWPIPHLQEGECIIYPERNRYGLSSFRKKLNFALVPRKVPHLTAPLESVVVCWRLPDFMLNQLPRGNPNHTLMYQIAQHRELEKERLLEEAAQQGTLDQEAYPYDIDGTPTSEAQLADIWRELTDIYPTLRLLTGQRIVEIDAPYITTSKYMGNYVADAIRAKYPEYEIVQAGDNGEILKISSR